MWANSSYATLDKIKQRNCRDHSGNKTEKAKHIKIEGRNKFQGLFVGLGSQVMIFLNYEMTYHSGLLFLPLPGENGYREVISTLKAL